MVFNAQVYFNLLHSYHSDFQYIYKDCTPPVQVGIIANVTVNFTKLQIMKNDKLWL